MPRFADNLGLRLRFTQRDGAHVRANHACLAGMCILMATPQLLSGGYQKEQPIGLILAATGSKYQPLGTQTPLAAKPGVFLFQGDLLFTQGGSVDLLWCPASAAKKFEYTIGGNASIKADTSPPPGVTGKELDICLLPALERSPEVTTLPSLDQMLPPPLPPATAAEEIANTPPGTATALKAMAGRDLNNPRLRLSFATMLANAGLSDEAVDQLRVLAKLWPDQVRIGRLVLDLLQSGSTRDIVQPKPPENTPAPSGKIYALVIGIQNYEQKGIEDLHFAAADATGFAAFMASARGGKAEVVTLTDSEAKLASIRNNLTDLLVKLRKDDTLVVFIAAHGSMQGDTPLVVTYRANPQDTAINGLPLSEIQKLRYGEISPFHEVRLFLDICHAGNIAIIEPAAPKGKPGSAPAPPPQFLYLAATHAGPDAFAYEDPIFGHGVFTYFLLRGLESGEARVANDHFVTAGSLTDYVETWVKNATRSGTDKQPRQRPESLVGVPLGSRIADVNLDGPKFDDPRPLPTLTVPANRLGQLRRHVPISKQAVTTHSEVPTGTPSSLDQRIALEDEGEAILLRYLEGDEIPQKVEDFRHCADIYAQALTLQPGSPYLEARRVFCVGRALVFEKHYDAAIERLERAIRLDPSAAYPYNALGIAYLEEGNYSIAQAAFGDAIERAPKWAYPRHNLALTHTQTGDYQEAIAAYRAAMERAPDYSYLPYNLGLVYQRMNRPEDAEAQYSTAIAKANLTPPGRAEPYVALGALKATQKKWQAAEDNYRKALTIPAGELTLRTARHDLAILLSRNETGRAEAESLWRQNGDYLPSQLSLAEDLASAGRTDDAIQLYRKILVAVPEHLPSRLLLAQQLQKAGKSATVISELHTALLLQPANPAVFEKLAASLAGSASKSEAIELLRTALTYSDGDTRSEIQRALKALGQVH